MSDEVLSEVSETDIAIVGMSGRFPRAPNIETFWQNVLNGVESVRDYGDDELRARGVPEHMLANPQLVRRSSLLEDMDKFDAPFFGFSPREAALLDPQQRVFLQVTHGALENAGYDPQRFDGAIGVFGAAGFNRYVIGLYTGRETPIEAYQIFTSNDKDFLATRVAYKLNLRGPSLTVGTACSSSLVVVHMACESLLSRQNDVVVAGAVGIHTRQLPAYVYMPGLIHSPDGYCRPFDARAAGTVAGSGAGAVVLKRLTDAVKDGDFIWAVIKGSAVNNDGAGKPSYTAPSVDGQASCIREAQSVAGVEARDVTYVEAHGTGTPLGDPIEIAGLTQSFRETTDDRHYCAIGAVKANIGHLDVAAGMAGLIKTAMVVHHRTLPPQINWTSPNPKIDFERSPFFVNTARRPWETAGRPRIAGVSAFGIGGTNAHVIVGEPPTVPRPASRERERIYLLSGRTQRALDENAAALARALGSEQRDARDVAYTLRHGRRAHEHRRAVVARTVEEAARIISTRDLHRQVSGRAGERRVVFMFPGQGAQYPNMLRGLFDSDEAFRADVESLCRKAADHLGAPLLQLLYPRTLDDTAAATLARTSYAQPAIFALSYALAQWWLRRGVRPRAMIGHSLGEYVAAALAGVFSADDAIRLVTRRGQIMESMPEGAMLSVAMTPEEARARLPKGLEIAAINAPSSVVFSGARDAVQSARVQLEGEGARCTVLATSHAFHSASMEAAVPQLVAELERVQLRPPQIPYASNLTGKWIEPQQATSPRYWGEHLRNPVLFDPGLAQVVKDSGDALLEVGPGRSLSALAGTRGGIEPERVVPSGRSPKAPISDVEAIYLAMGRLWANGVEMEWGEVDESGYRVPLPSYSFEPERHWMDPVQPAAAPLRRGRARAQAGRATTTQQTGAGTPSRDLDALVRSSLGEVLGVEPGAIKPDQLLARELGLTSLLSIDLRNRLQDALGVSLPATLIFDHPTLAKLLTFLESLIAAKPAATPSATPVATPEPSTDTDDTSIAIIGASCRLPGANSLDELWRLFRDAGWPIREVPASRWDVDSFYDPRPATPGKMASGLGGFIDGIDTFDAAFFGLNVDEAKALDPQQRLLLELAWEAVEHGGVAPTALSGSRTGVFVGLFTNDYQMLQVRHDQGARRAGTQRSYWLTFNVAAGLISNFLDLRGPSENLNTASSSSMAAVHRACQALLAGECDLALAGGSSAMFDPQATVALSQMGKLALDGACKSFDARSDGYVRCEAGGMVALKRLADAERDGDLVLAVVRTSAVRNNGRAAGFGTPSAEAQRELLESALEQAATDGGDVQFIEAHASGTALGDAVELQQIGAVYGSAAKLPVIGSSHTNFGHADAASGVVSLLKTVLTVSRGEIAPNLHLRETHPFLDLAQLGLVLPTERRPWRRDLGQIAAVSSFGASGTIAHALVQPYENRAPSLDQARPVELFAISARSPVALAELADRYRAFLVDRPSVSLASICHTAAIGRAHFDHRLAVVVATRDELLEALRGASPQSPRQALTHVSMSVRDLEGIGVDLVRALTRELGLVRSSLAAMLRVPANAAHDEILATWEAQPPPARGPLLAWAVADALSALGLHVAFPDSALLGATGKTREEAITALREGRTPPSTDRGAAPVAALPLELAQQPVAAVRSVLSVVAEAYRSGAALQLGALERGRRLRARLPTYAFQRKRYWFSEG